MSAECGSPSGWIDYFGQAIRTSVNYLPSQVSEVLTQSRDYAVAKLPVSGVKNVCAIATYVCDLLPHCFETVGWASGRVSGLYEIE